MWNICFWKGKTKGAGGKGAGGEFGCFEFFVCRGKKSDLVDDGVDEFSGYGWAVLYSKGLLTPNFFLNP